MHTANRSSRSGLNFKHEDTAVSSCALLAHKQGYTSTDRKIHFANWKRILASKHGYKQCMFDTGFEMYFMRKVIYSHYADLFFCLLFVLFSAKKIAKGDSNLQFRYFLSLLFFYGSLNCSVTGQIAHASLCPYTVNGASASSSISFSSRS